jgi:hypothetical protein
VAFRFEGTDPSRHGRIFVKVLLGLPGDEVKQRSRQFTVTEQAVSQDDRGLALATADADGEGDMDGLGAVASAPSAPSIASIASIPSIGSAAHSEGSHPAHPREHFAGQAKTIGLDGQALQPGPTGVLPAGRFYVYAPHTDSLDSRYAPTGWIHQRQIIGRAHALF